MPTLRNRVVYVKDISELKEQISENELVCVHFATEWCPPSKDMEAVVNTMARWALLEYSIVIFLQRFWRRSGFRPLRPRKSRRDSLRNAHQGRKKSDREKIIVLGFADRNHLPKFKRNWKNWRPERARHPRCFEKGAWIKKNSSFLCNFSLFYLLKWIMRIIRVFFVIPNFF